MMVSRMSVDKDKVNQILLEFQNILKKFRPNTSELQLINKKISQMTARNVRKSTSKGYASQERYSTAEKSSTPLKKWHKIKIE